MTDPVSRILFASAISDRSVSSLAYVVALAATTGASVRVLHVVEALSEDARATLAAFIQDEAARRNAISRRLDDARNRLLERHESFWAGTSEAHRAVRNRLETDVVEGFPADVILREARRQRADMIVLGAHEHGLSHTFLGTIAKRVLRRAEVPTLIIPHRDDA